MDSRPIAVERSRVIAIAESFSEFKPLYARQKPDKGMTPWSWAHASTTHVNQALFAPGAKRALKENVQAGWCVVLDDIGTKVERKPPTPTFVIETRPGNYQYVYVLDEPASIDKHEPLIKNLRAAGWTDPGASSGTLQWFRLPGSLPPGKKHEARLKRWTKKRFSFKRICELFDVPHTARRRTFAPIPPPANLDKLNEEWASLIQMFCLLKLLIDYDERTGKAFVICPWVDQHSDGDTSGTVLLPPHEKNGWKGTFHCSHGHCVHRGVGSVYEYIAARVKELTK